MDGTPITDCNGSFFDPGGGNGNYGDNQNFATTICSDGSNGTHIRIDFSGIDLAAGDALCFYDGTDVLAPLLSCAADYDPGQPITIQATAVNPSGCLTVEFISDASGTATGWAGIISCVPSCQQVLAELVSTDPVSVPLDTGWIDVCPGERIFFTGQGIYPQNDFAYHQSDSTTTFEWSFGDGDIAYGPSVSHRFDEPGGYYVQLFLTDDSGCRNTNLINQRIRVAPRPNFGIGTAFTQNICAGDTIQLSASVDTLLNENLLVTPNTGAFASGGSRSDSLAVPDGTGIPYSTSIYFTEFSPGQVLTDIDDLLSICVNMEHSWMRDVEISLTCPSGQNIVLHNFAGQTGGQVFLGIPIDNDGLNPIPGTGYDYCWTNNAPNPTWIQYANTILGGNGTLPPGDYSTFDPMSDLLGCPLNGEWTITVTDLWPIDNGYIFSWGIDFDPSLYPSLETFTPGFVNWGWDNHPSIFYQDPDSIAAAPTNAGTAGYVFTVEDEFGCTWDTLINISILPYTHPDCYSCVETYTPLADALICDGDSAFLDATFLGATSLPVQFEAFPDYEFGNGNHPHSNPFVSPISVNSLGYSNISDATTQIESICIDIETDFDSDLNIFLRSPNNQTLELSTGNGGSGDNYQITCFKPTASTPIVGSAAPFNGDFSPEGNWTSLNGAQVDGNWSLVVSDGFGVNQLGKVNWWSITFNSENNINYLWSNAGSLSCNNCPDPAAFPTDTTTYFLTAVDSYNCIHKDTVTVFPIDVYPAPSNLIVSNMSGGEITWTWDPVPGAISYIVNINGTGWIPSNGMQSHTITGLVSGDPANIEVQAVGNANCPPDITSLNTTYFECTLAGVFVSSQDPLCFGDFSGSAVINATGNTGPVQFSTALVSGPQTNGVFNSVFNAGAHQIILVDSVGCRDTISFTLMNPPQLTLAVSGTDALCNGENSGIAVGQGNGGTGTINYQWAPCAGGTVQNTATATNLIAGCYSLMITDANGCTLVDSVEINEPAALSFSSTQDSVSCSGGADGGAHITVSGGTSPYQYLWDNGDTTPDPTGLDAGFHSVTITDAQMCQSVTLVQVLEPLPLNVDDLAGMDVDCFGESTGSITASISGGTQPYTFTLDNGASGNPIQNLAAGNYLLDVSDANGCVLDDLPIAINQPATAVSVSQLNASPSCFGQSNGSLQVNAQGGNGAPFDYLWSNGQTQDLASNLGAGIYTVTASDSKGCTATGIFELSSFDAIVTNVLTDIPSCFGVADGQAAVNLIQGGGGMGDPANYHFEWSVPGSPDNIFISGLAGDMEYYVTVTDNFGCSGIDTFFLFQPPPLDFTLVLDSVDCNGGANGSAALGNVPGGQTIAGFEWSNGDTDPLADNLAAGMYSVTLTDLDGCQGEQAFTIEEPAALAVDVDIKDLRCYGYSDAQIDVIASGGTPGYQISWSTGTSGASIQDLPAGSYQFTITDGKGCTLDQTVLIDEPDSLIVQGTAINVACFNANNGVIQVEVVGGAPSYRFSLDSIQFQNAGFFTSLATGNYTVYVVDGEGCTGSVDLSITAPPPLSVELAPDTTIYLGESLLLEAEVSNGFAPIEYIWTSNILDSMLCDDPECSALLVTPNLNNRYTIQITDANGCEAEATILVDVLKPREVYVPTGFTPNSDLINDLLVVYGVSRTIETIDVFRVYDRWGELVYEDFDVVPNDESRGWNGQFRGKDCDPGVYVWYLEVRYKDGFEDRLHGNTTLIR
jgi:gliding motility-associated-like protein